MNRTKVTDTLSPDQTKNLSMNRPIVYVLALVAAAGSWFVLQNTVPQSPDPSAGNPRDPAGPRRIAELVTQRETTSRSRHGRTSTGSVAAGHPELGRFGTRGAAVVPQQIEMDPRQQGTIRVASMNLLPLDSVKAGKLRVMAMLSAMVRHFDVVAVQGVVSDDAGLLPRWIDQINVNGRHFDYAVGPPVGRQDRQQFAFLYNRKTIDIDRHQLYTIDDPEDVLAFEPFVGCFRARGPPGHEAFTFSLVNVLIPASGREVEGKIMGEVFRRVRNDGRDEDDVLLAGDFHSTSFELRKLIEIADLVVHIVGTRPTSTSGDQQTANILFSRQASLEFTGRSGVFDFMRAFNLSLDQALEVSPQMPIWSEFSVFEGGELGRVARRH